MSRYAVVVFFAIALGLGSFAHAQSAATDPTQDQIYQAATHGRLGEAERMVEQVLRDHPASAKAHFVAAEVYAKARDFNRARHELSTAEQLKPGLPFETPSAVAALKAELGGTSALSPVHESTRPFSFPWGVVVLIAIAVALVWMLLRRRREDQYRYATQLPAAATGPQYGPGYGPSPGVGPVMGGGGLGSNSAGGLARGLAVGAGVVVGEELARHFLNRDEHGTVIPPPEHDVQPQTNPDINADMGGNDFGMNSQEASSWDDDSSSSSWDDGGSFGDGGGGDWS